MYKKFTWADKKRQFNEQAISMKSDEEKLKDIRQVFARLDAFIDKVQKWKQNENK